MSLTERHVRARIDKRTIRCTSTPGRQSVAGGVQFAPCSGWVIKDRDTKPRLVACADCNGLAPMRLRVDDKQVRLLPEALRALENTQREVENRKRTARYTIHWYETQPYDEIRLEQRVACGATLGKTPTGRRVHQAVAALRMVTCDECRRLAALTPAQREQERKDKSAALRAKFADKNAAKFAEREAKRLETAAQVEAGRHDARVALDALEEVAFNATKLTTERWEFVRKTLDIALVAYKFENPKSRGDRDWVTKVCAEGPDTVRSKYVDIQCRYCRETLLEHKRQGFDYTWETAGHTTPCALRYLAKDA